MAKKYTEDERTEALKLAKEIGVRESGRRLGINEDTQYTWQSKAKHRAQEVTAVLEEKGPEGLVRENEALRKELKERAEEVEILQNALSF